MNAMKKILFMLGVVGALMSSQVGAFEGCEIIECVDVDVNADVDETVDVDIDSDDADKDVIELQITVEDDAVTDIRPKHKNNGGHHKNRKNHNGQKKYKAPNTQPKRQSTCSIRCARTRRDDQRKVGQ
jgi:hypothetical protein